MVVGVVLRAADTFQASTSALSEGIPQLDKTFGRAGQDSWPNWTILKGLHSGRGFLGNKRFFTCGT